jgi:hypothetical protein
MGTERSSMDKRTRGVLSFTSLASFLSFISIIPLALGLAYFGAVEIPPAGFLIASL